MPSTIERLPEDLLELLKAKLRENHFGNLDAIVELVNQALVERGDETRISRSSLSRYSHNKLQPMLAQIQFSAELASTLAKSTPDIEGNINEALIRLVQDKMIRMLFDLEQDQIPSPKEMSSLAQAIAQLTRASVSQKKYREEVVRKATEAASEVEQTVKAAGLSDNAAAAIRAKILGVAA
jgi:hypothetical protein